MSPELKRPRLLAHSQTLPPAPRKLLGDGAHREARWRWLLRQRRPSGGGGRHGGGREGGGVPDMPGGGGGGRHGLTLRLHWHTQGERSPLFLSLPPSLSPSESFFAWMFEVPR